MADTPQTTTTTTTAPPPPASSSKAQQPQRIPDADYQKLTTAEKASYAHQFPQDRYQPGGPEAAGRTAATADAPAADAGDKTAPPAGSVQLDGERIKIGETELTHQEVLDAVAAKAAQDSRRASLPAPDAYKFELPADFKLPGDVKITFDPKDPITGPVLRSAAEWAHKRGMDQQAFSEMLSLHAATQADSANKIIEAKKAEITKLGPAGPARIDALNLFFKGYGVPKLAGTLWTADIVDSFERLVARVTSGGAASFGQGGRVPPDNSGRVDQATYDKMSATEKRAYAQRFDQTQFQGR
jgi:hypothetical protein